MRWVGLAMVLSTVGCLVYMVVRRPFTRARGLATAFAGLVMGTGFWLLDGRLEGLVAGPLLFPLMYWGNSRREADVD